MTTLVNAKSALRRTMRDARKRLSDDDHARLSDQACQHLFSCVQAKCAGPIASYWPIGSELSTKPFHTMVRGAAMGPLLLPAIDGSKGDLPALVFRVVSAEADLIAADHGTLEPPAHCSVAVPKTIIVPGLGFDLRGNRLGQGKGFYDTTLAALRREMPDLQVIGLCFECQIASSIPTEPHDATMDAVVTERGVHYVKGLTH